MGDVIALIGYVIPYLLMACAFGFVNFYMPNTNVKPRSAFVGGLFTAVIWKIMGVIFAAFIASSSQQTAIYSAFASIIVFMVWLYVGWLVLLIGASIASYHQNPKRMIAKQTKQIPSIACRKKLTLSLMYVIAKNHYDHKSEANAIDELAEKFYIPSEYVYELAEPLIQNGFLVTSSDERSRKLFPAQPLQHITLFDVEMALESMGSHDGYYYSKIKKNPVDAYLEEYEKQFKNNKNNKTLLELVETK